eukprot:COSAG04_NODE_35_length_34355_cov_13.301728_17_plen_67_part_00
MNDFAPLTATVSSTLAQRGRGDTPPERQAPAQRWVLWGTPAGAPSWGAGRRTPADPLRRDCRQRIS